MKTQQSIKDGIQNLINNQGIFVQEKEIEFEGEKVIAILVLPSKFAFRAEDILHELIPTIEEETEDTEEDDDTEGFENHETDEETEPPKKKATKKATKKAVKKSKK